MSLLILKGGQEGPVTGDLTGLYFVSLEKTKDRLGPTAGTAYLDDLRNVRTVQWTGQATAGDQNRPEHDLLG